MQISGGKGREHSRGHVCHLSANHTEWTQPLSLLWHVGHHSANPGGKGREHSRGNVSHISADPSDKHEATLAFWRKDVWQEQPFTTTRWPTKLGLWPHLLTGTTEGPHIEAYATDDSAHAATQRLQGTSPVMRAPSYPNPRIPAPTRAVHQARVTRKMCSAADWPAA